MLAMVALSHSYCKMGSKGEDDDDNDGDKTTTMRVRSMMMMGRVVNEGGPTRGVEGQRRRGQGRKQQEGEKLGSRK